MFLNNESDYYFARERAARRLAANSKDRAATAAHLVMAEEYRRRAFAARRADEGFSVAGQSSSKVRSH